jgi:hypothetical protein
VNQVMAKATQRSEVDYSSYHPIIYF